MSKVLSLRLKEDQVERLERAARRWGRSPSSAAVLLLEEALRQREFPYVEFRDSVVGRQAYLNGHRLSVWQIEWIARYFDHDAGKTADYLRLRPVQVEGALSYADASLVALSEKLHMETIFTFDDDFRRAGLTVVPAP